MKMIEVEIISQKSINVEIENSKEIGVDITGQIIPVGEYKHYEGDYSVKPKLEKQTLKTQGLVMDFDLDVGEIPIATVSNTSGGNTVIIGA